MGHYNSLFKTNSSLSQNPFFSFFNSLTIQHGSHISYQSINSQIIPCFSSKPHLKSSINHLESKYLFSLSQHYLKHILLDTIPRRVFKMFVKRCILLKPEVTQNSYTINKRGYSLIKIRILVEGYAPQLLYLAYLWVLVFYKKTQKNSR